MSREQLLNLKEKGEEMQKLRPNKIMRELR
jgi:hypothetical protein